MMNVQMSSNKLVPTLSNSSSSSHLQQQQQQQMNGLSGGSSGLRPPPAVTSALVGGTQMQHSPLGGVKSNSGASAGVMLASNGDLGSVPSAKAVSDWIPESNAEHGVVGRAFVLYLGGIRFESLSTHHCWAKSFIPILLVWSMTQNNTFGGEKQNKKSNGEQSELCDLEQVALKPQLQVHHCLTI